MSVKVAKAAVHQAQQRAAIFIAVECFHSSVDEFLKHLERYLDVVRLTLEKIAESVPE